MDEALSFIEAVWPAPRRVRAIVSTRGGGRSVSPWNSLNLALHVGDDAAAVMGNRALLVETLGIPAQPQWLEQVHGCAVVDAASDGIERRGDAAYTRDPGTVCAVLTADCLPVMLCDDAGTEVAVAHCGWRGLAGGVLRNTVDRFSQRPSRLHAWLGPAIGPGAFEVGADVRDAFLGTALDPSHREAVSLAFGRCANDASKLNADLYALARAELAAIGVLSVHGGGGCTLSEEVRFFSYRRDGVTGRMASLIWISAAG